MLLYRSTITILLAKGAGGLSDIHVNIKVAFLIQMMKNWKEEIIWYTSFFFSILKHPLMVEGSTLLYIIDYHFNL